jgi:hypothetical protein
MRFQAIKNIGRRLKFAWRADAARPLTAPLGVVRRLDCLEYEERVLYSATPAGGELLANTETAAAQSADTAAQQAVAVDPAGDFVVAWASAGQDGTGSGIYAQRFDAAGNKLGSELQVNSTFLGDQVEAAVVKGADGSFVVSWSGPILDILGITILGEGIYFQRFDASGNPVGGEQQVALALLEDFSQPSIAMNTAGDFKISWTRAFGDGSGDGVFARQFHANGSPDGGVFQVNVTSAGDQNDSTVAYDGTGNLIVTWTSAGQDGSGTGVYGRRFDSGGSALGGEFQIHTTTAGNQSEASVAADSAGDFVVSWTSQGQDGSGLGIYAQRFNAAGARVGSEFLVNATTAGDQHESRTAMDAAGNFTIAWTGAGQDSGATDGIYFRQYDSSGTAISPETLVNRTIAGNQSDPSLAINDSGAMVVAWSGNGPGDADGVLFQRYVDGPNTAPVNTVPGTQTTVEDTTLVFSSGGSNGISIADASAAGNSVQVTLTATSGTVTLSGLTGLTFTAGDGTADTSMTFRGTIANINTALNGLSFTPTLDFAGAAAVAITTNDLGYSGTGGAMATATSVTINVTPVNDHVPTITSNGGGAAASVSVAENTSAVTTVVGTDADLPTPTLSYSISGGADAGRFAIDASTGALSFVAAPNFEAPSDSDGNNVYQVIVRASDGTFAATQTIAVAVTNVNEAPTVVVPTAQSTPFGTALPFSITGGRAITLADVDAGNAPIELTLTADHGTLTLAQTTGLTFVAGDGIADSAMIVRGSVAALNAALDGLQFAPTNAYRGAASIALSVDDLGQSGSGAANVINDQIAIQVAPAADRIQLSAPTTINAADFAALFSQAGGSGISIVDAYGEDPMLTVTLTAANGTATLAQTAGLTFVGGTGSSGALIAFSGRLSDVNAALDGLQFQGDTTSGGLSLTVTDEPRDGTDAQTRSASIGVVQQAIYPSPGPATGGVDDDPLTPITNPTNEPSGTSRVPLVPSPGTTSGSDVDNLFGDERLGSVDVLTWDEEQELLLGRRSASTLGLGDDGEYAAYFRGASDAGAASGAAKKPGAFARAGGAPKGGLAARAAMESGGDESAVPWSIVTAEVEAAELSTAEYLVVGTAGLTATLTVGYLVWSLQAGSMTSILLSSLPTWRAFDPLPVLEHERRRRKRTIDVDELDGVFDLRNSMPDLDGALGAR